MIGGGLEAGVGAVGGVATSETGAGAVVGWLAMLHGSDNAAAGFRQMMTGEETKSFTEKGISEGLQQVGVSKDKANQIASFADFAISAALSGGTSMAKDGTMVPIMPKPVLPAPRLQNMPPPVLKGISLGGSAPKVPLPLKPANKDKIISGCEAIAAEVQKVIGGEFLQITPKFGNQLGPVQYAKGAAPYWAHHVAVIKEGIVYDMMTGSKGMLLNDYKAMFEYAEAILFEVVPKVTVK